MSNSPRGQQPRDPREDDEIERLKRRLDGLKLETHSPRRVATAMFRPMPMSHETAEAGDVERGKLARVLLLGAALGVALAVVAHFTGAAWLLNNLGPLGAFLSLVTGLVFGLILTARQYRGAMLGGMAAGAGCAFAGIASSVLLGDVLLFTLPLGTLGGAVVGLLGGLAGRLVGKLRG